MNNQLQNNSNTHYLRVLHLNDFHGISFPAVNGDFDIVEFIKVMENRIEDFGKKKTNYDHSLCLFLGSGDLISAKSIFRRQKGQVTMQCFRYTPLRLSTLGNHEFDFGSDKVRELWDSSNFCPTGNFDYVCSNVELTPVLAGLKHPYCLDFGDMQIKIFGLITEDLKDICPPEYIQNVDITDLPINNRSNINPVFKEVTKKENEFHIALTHIGLDDDFKLAKNSIVNFDLILGGHTHHKIPAQLVGDTIGDLVQEDGQEGKRIINNIPRGASDRRVFYGQSGSEGNHIGDIEIRFQENKITYFNAFLCPVPY